MTFPRFNDFFLNLWSKSKLCDFLKFYDSWEACSDVSTINFKQITHIVLVFPVLTLNK